MRSQSQTRLSDFQFHFSFIISIFSIKAIFANYTIPLFSYFFLLFLGHIFRLSFMPDNFLMLDIMKFMLLFYSEFCCVHLNNVLFLAESKVTSKSM